MVAPFFTIRGCQGRPPAALTIAALLAVVAGCGKSDGDDFVPVAGIVKLDGKPLTVGAVSFRPDGAKGNASMHIPTGQVDSQGRFELITIGQKGAPKGWYKVLVFADEYALVEYEGSRPPTPKWMTNEKYIDEATTPLSIEVVEKPAPGAYDLEVTK